MGYSILELLESRLGIRICENPRLRCCICDSWHELRTYWWLVGNVAIEAMYNPFTILADSLPNHQ